MNRLQRWAIAFAIMVVAAASAFVFVDRPIAFLAHDTLRHYKIFVQMTKLPESFNTIGSILVVGIGLWALGGRPLARWHRVALVWSVSVFSAWVIKNQLKIVFGRTWPETWVQGNPSLIRDGAYGFNLFHKGDWYEAFPSGHTAAICAAMTVLWICYPRWRPVYALAIAMVVIGLIGANFHFVSDIIAGGFIGVSVGWVAVMLTGLAPATLTPPARS
jgi:membrane-associated phospholipid phosphatase